MVFTKLNYPNIFMCHSDLNLFHSKNRTKPSSHQILLTAYYVPGTVDDQNIISLACILL